jgi:hypothetical protein
LICRARSFFRTDGARAAEIVAAMPFAEWGEHTDRVRGALTAIGCAPSEIDRAIRCAKLDRSQRLLRWCIIPIDENGIARTSCSYIRRPDVSDRHGVAGVALQWDGQTLVVVDQWGTLPAKGWSTSDELLDRATEFCLVSRCERDEIEQRRDAIRAREYAAMVTRNVRAKPVPPTSRIVRGSRRSSRRNARRRVNA